MRLERSASGHTLGIAAKRSEINTDIRIRRSRTALLKRRREKNN